MTSEIDDITWAMMSEAGIDTDTVELHGTGSWYVLDRPDFHIDFGPGKTETGEPADGWDITVYGKAMEYGEAVRENETYYYEPTAELCVKLVAKLVKNLSS